MLDSDIKKTLDSLEYILLCGNIKVLNFCISLSSYMSIIIGKAKRIIGVTSENRIMGRRKKLSRPSPAHLPTRPQHLIVYVGPRVTAVMYRRSTDCIL